MNDATMKICLLTLCYELINFPPADPQGGVLAANLNWPIGGSAEQPLGSSADDE